MRISSMTGSARQISRDGTWSGLASKSGSVHRARGCGQWPAPPRLRKRCQALHPSRIGALAVLDVERSDELVVTHRIKPANARVKPVTGPVLPQAHRAARTIQVADLAADEVVVLCGCSVASNVFRTQRCASSSATASRSPSASRIAHLGHLRRDYRTAVEDGQREPRGFFSGSAATRDSKLQRLKWDYLTSAPDAVEGIEWTRWLTAGNPMHPGSRCRSNRRDGLRSSPCPRGRIG